MQQGVITKAHRQTFLHIAQRCCYKLRLVRCFQLRKVWLKIATLQIAQGAISSCDRYITKCDTHYKLRQYTRVEICFELFITNCNKVLLQIATVHFTTNATRVTNHHKFYYKLRLVITKCHKFYYKLQHTVICVRI